MSSTRITSRRLIALALAATGAAGLSACGSSTPSSQSARANQGIKFSQCMRSHGVPNFPDPSGGGGGGFHIQIGGDVNPQSPSFQSAQNTCSKLQPGGGPVSPKTSAARHAQLVTLAQCMRAHGISSFPDPTNSPPSRGPGAGGGGIAFGGPGGFISISAATMDSPGFSEAEKECNFPGAAPPPGKGRGLTLDKPAS